MLRTRNKYCSNCLATVRFLDLGDCLVCERCNKRLEIGATSAVRDIRDGLGVRHDEPVAPASVTPAPFTPTTRAA